jgi:hypothetical protein
MFVLSLSYRDLPTSNNFHQYLFLIVLLASNCSLASSEHFYSYIISWTEQVAFQSDDDEYH